MGEVYDGQERLPSPQTGAPFQAVVAGRVEQLLLHLQPSWASEIRRLAVAEYVCSIIRHCFYPRQVRGCLLAKYAVQPLKLPIPTPGRWTLSCLAPCPSRQCCLMVTWTSLCSHPAVRSGTPGQLSC